MRKCAVGMLSSAYRLKKLRREPEPSIYKIKQEQRFYQQYAKKFNLTRHHLRNEVEVDQEIENIKMVVESIEADIDFIIQSIPDAYAHLVSGEPIADDNKETSK